MLYNTQTTLDEKLHKPAATNYRLSDSCVRCDHCQRDYGQSRIVCRIDPRVVISTSCVCDMFVRDAELTDEVA